MGVPMGFVRWTEVGVSVERKVCSSTIVAVNLAFRRRLALDPAAIPHGNAAVPAIAR